MTDGVGSENYSFNSLEQPTQLQKIVSGTTYTTNYLYNVAGELTQITYPSGRVVQQSVDAIGRLCEIAPSTTGCGTASSPYATGYAYNAASQLTGFKYGNGIFASLGFSATRLQLNCLDYSTTNRSGTCTHDSTTKFGLTYTYGTGTANNGQILGITDSVDNGRTVAYSYDPLSRLATALTTGSTAYPQWGLSWNYDGFGNRTAQNLTAGSGYSGSVSVNALTNHITTSPYAYDANGNMTNDATNTLVYDAENRAISATNSSSSGAYTYDGNGLRVKKVSGATTTVYIFSGSKVIAEYDNGAAVGSPSREYVYGGSALLAKVAGSTTTYYHQDQVSNRLVTSSTGSTVAQMGHYPFGDPWYNATNDKLYFTTYARDSESGNDYAQARFYRYLVGRFLSPDPLPGSSSIPQSLNRYAYAANDPIDNTDPTGRCIPPGSYLYGGTHIGIQCPPNTDGSLIYGSSGDSYSGGSPGYCGAQYSSCQSENPVYSYTPTGFGDPRCGINASCIARGYSPLSSPQADPNNPIYAPSDQSDFQITVLCDEGLGGPDDSVCNLASWSKRFAINGNQPAYLNGAGLRQVAAGVIKGAGGIGSARFIGGFYLASGGSALIDGVIADYSAGPLESNLFGRYNAAQGGGVPGILNYPSYPVRLGYGWNGEIGQMVFRLSIEEVGHIDFWTVPFP
jgi:RHS repeat-associated protein